MNLVGYEIAHVISHGGFGTVYLAFRRTDGRQVAIKVLRLPNDENVRRFYREATLLHRELMNPHVVDLIEADLDHSPPLIVMEYCQGGSLESWVQQRHPWGEVVLALAHAAQGLCGIHARNGFHRDIKPGNLLLTRPLSEGGVVKVGDFGLARVPMASSGPMTRSPWGTEGYIAPEVYISRTHTAQADVYSLGITGIELLTGNRDPNGLANASGPRALHEFLRRMVNLDSKQRPTMAECASRFKTLLVQSESPAESPARGGFQPAAQPAGGRGIVGAILATLALLAVGAAATANKKDANGRYHGRDGKFRGGRWG